MDRLKVIIACNRREAMEALDNIIVDTDKAVVLRRVVDFGEVAALVVDHQPDVLFINVSMLETTPSEFLKAVHDVSTNLEVCFVFDTPDVKERYSSEDIHLSLVKPIRRKAIECMVFNAYNKKNNYAGIHLKFPVSDGFVLLEPHEILMLKAEGNYTKIFTVADDSYVSSYNMGRLLKRLPQPLFERVNRSCAVNMDYVVKIKKAQLTCVVKTDTKEFEEEESKVFLKRFNKRYV